MAKKTFNEQLRLARIKSGLPVIEIAERMKITREAFYQYESGKSTPSLNDITRLEEILGVTDGTLILSSKHATLAQKVVRTLMTRALSGETEHATN